MHFARTMPFDELEAGLQREIEAGYVSFVSDGSLMLFKYTDRCTFDRAWTPFSLHARGLILDIMARCVVATPFPKFFNYGEGMAPSVGMEPLPDEPFTVTEKVDGSLGIVFWHDGRWRVTTRGSFVSGQAVWAATHIRVSIDTSWLRIGTTYLVEIVYPSNRIVVPYDYEGLVILGAYGPNGAELDADLLREELSCAGFLVPRVERFAGLDALLLAAKTLPSSEEGFVVRFASGRRLKVKGDEYCRIHRLVSRVTPLAVFEMLIAGDDSQMVARELPEEFRKDFDTIWALLSEKLEHLIRAVADAKSSTDEMSDKELGLWLGYQQVLSETVSRWIFPARKKRFLEVVHEPGHDLRKRACETFRPTANRLDGYTPSSAMNRFTVEA